MDRLDHAILRQLQANGRLRLTELAERVGLSPTPCARRVAALEKDGVIQKYIAVLDQTRMGLPISAFISIELKEQSSELMKNFEAAVTDFEEVMDCWLMTGSQDYLIRAVAPDLQAYERFLQNKLSRVEGIGRMRTRFALKQAVRRAVLPTV
jgi:Lrp/AsnC family leucine-responsive transcriptional regulator